jgi:hypothetical protein
MKGQKPDTERSKTEASNLDGGQVIALSVSYGSSYARQTFADVRVQQDNSGRSAQSGSV